MSHTKEQLEAGIAAYLAFFRAIRREFGRSPSAVRKDGHYFP
jgi:AraC-like DNA-binding protein